MKNDFEIRDDGVIIYLQNGFKTIIDKGDFENVSKIPGRWYANFNNKNGKAYVCTHFIDEYGNSKKILLHRLVLFGFDEMHNSLHCDHISHNSLDNRRANLVAKSFARNVKRKQTFINVSRHGKNWTVSKGNEKLYETEDRRSAHIVALLCELKYLPQLRRFKSFEKLFARYGVDYSFVQLNYLGSEPNAK